MSIADNKVVVQQYFDEVWNKGNLAAIGEYVADDIRDYALGPDPTPGQGSVLAHRATVLAGFPDFHIDIEDLVAEGDRVVAVWAFSGTDAATGKRVSGVRAISRLRVVGGKVAEYRVLADARDLQRQLGEPGTD